MTKRRDTPESRQRADIYRAAAKLMEDGLSDRPCCAIETVQGLRTYDWSPARKAFIEHVIGTNATAELYGYDAAVYNGAEAHNARIVQLCLMAAMVEAGDA